MGASSGLNVAAAVQVHVHRTLTLSQFVTLDDCVPCVHMLQWNMLFQDPEMLRLHFNGCFACVRVVFSLTFVFKPEIQTPFSHKVAKFIHKF